MMIEIFSSLSLTRFSFSMFMLKNEIFITQNDVWQAPVVTLFSRLLSLSSLPLRVLLLWSVNNKKRKNAYIFI